jgi:hypothetical protein
MPRRDEVFPSKYLKAPDLNGQPRDLMIERVPLEHLKTPDGKEQDRVVLYFRGAKKGLVLNVTNFDAVSAIVGDDNSDNWPGHPVQLYPDKTHMGGKLVDCIRITAPAQRELPKSKPPSDDELDDDIPF